MTRLRSQRGAISAGMIIAIFLLLFLIYEGMQFGPLLITQFQFQDAVIESTKFSRGKTAQEVQQEIAKKAGELQLPISRDMIKVTRQPTNTRVQVSYQLTAEWLPGKPYTWTVNVDEESVLF